MNSPSRSQPNSERDDFTRRMMSNIDGSQDTEIASLKARIEELEGALREISSCAIVGYYLNGKEGWSDLALLLTKFNSELQKRVKIAEDALEVKHD